MPPERCCSARLGGALVERSYASLSDEPTATGPVDRAVSATWEGRLLSESDRLPDAPAPRAVQVRHSLAVASKRPVDETLEEHGQVRRRGDVVLRPLAPWSSGVLALLRHLEREDFRGAPRVVGDGVDDGYQALTFIPGESPHPRAWTDDAVAAIGVMLRALHRATASFASPPGVVWRPWFGRDLPGSSPIIGHCDSAPWNIIARGGAPVAFADWENCGPVDARWELVQTVWLNAQLHDDDVAERNGLPDTSTRAKQARMILDGYGLPPSEREDFVDAMVEFAIRSAAQDAIDGGVTPDSILPMEGPGRSGGEPLAPHQVAWGVAWRTRAAAWMLRNRPILERALT
jgi:hypothetical protein